MNSVAVNDRIDLIRKELLKALQAIGYSPENFYFNFLQRSSGVSVSPRDVAYAFDELFRQGLITVAKVEFVGRSFQTHFMITPEGRIEASREAPRQQ